VGICMYIFGEYTTRYVSLLVRQYIRTVVQGATPFDFLGGSSMKKKHLAVVTLFSLVLLGCSSGDGTTVRHLEEQSGSQSYLFYGEAEAKALGSLKNVSIIDSSNPDNPLLKQIDTSAIRYAVPSSSMAYDTETKKYKELTVQHLSYASGTKAYTVDMKRGESDPQAVQNSSADKLSDFTYTKVNYLGETNFLVAHDDELNQTVLITPDMNSTRPPIVFGDRKLLSVTYSSYGEPVSGYLVYNSDSKQVETCLSNMEDCTEITDAGSRDYKGDVPGTTYSVLYSRGTIRRIDKSSGDVVEITLNGKEVKSGHGTTSFQGGSFYFIATDGTLNRVDIKNKKLIEIAKGDFIERIRSFTEEWVIFGSDVLLLAAKKDGSTTKPVKLIETDLTKGYKYVYYGMKDRYLYVTYALDPESGKTTFDACIFEDGETECKANSFWAGIALAKEGVYSPESSLPYTPYAFVRVDVNDTYGGGTLKAIDPNHPFDDGIAMGSVSNYNFQTFLSNSRFLASTIDSNGGIVLYAKDDTTFKVDAFYMNLLKENSLKKLTDNDVSKVTSGRDHCHGRHCMLCHSFAGGKIYQDINGSRSAYGYTLKFEFRNGETLKAKVAKGKGENFAIDARKLQGDFTALVVDENGDVVNQSAPYTHRGAKRANCNFCHARGGVTRHGAYGVITTHMTIE